MSLCLFSAAFTSLIQDLPSELEIVLLLEWVQPLICFEHF